MPQGTLPPSCPQQHGAHHRLDDACRAAQAAHSTVRALYKSYAGPLYQVKRKDGKTMDIKVSAPGGFADSATQDKFCAGSSCVFFQLYDQSPQGNHLGVAPGGGAHRQEDIPANAAADPLMVGGHKVYGLRMDPPSGYRRDNTSGIAIHDEPETIYAVFNGSHYNNRCCFDCESRLCTDPRSCALSRSHSHSNTCAVRSADGNAETDNHDDGAGTMEALYFGSAKGGLNHGGAGTGPWIMAGASTPTRAAALPGKSVAHHRCLVSATVRVRASDMENALWGADKVVSNEEPITHDFVTAMIKGDSGAAPGHWAIKGGNAQAGMLKSYWDGHRAPHYAPMKKQVWLVFISRVCGLVFTQSHPLTVRWPVSPTGSDYPWDRRR